MGVFAEYFAEVKLEVSSPDGQLRAMWDQTSGLLFALRDGCYSGYSETEMERQLAALLSSYFSAHRQARLEALSRAYGRHLNRETDGILEMDTKPRRFEELRAKITPVGKSGKDLVRITSTAMTHQWKVAVKPGTLKSLPDREFVGELRSALDSLNRDFAVKVAGLREQIFGKLYDPRLSR